MLPKVVTVALLALLGVAVAKRIQDQGVDNGMREALEGMDAGVSQEQAEGATQEAWSRSEAWKEHVKLATSEVSQKQIELALKEAEGMMADADFSKQLQALEEQVNADPKLQKQLEAYEEELSANPDIQKRLALVQEQTEAMAPEQPFSAALLEVDENSSGSWSMRQALAMLLLASDDTHAYQVNAPGQGGHVSTFRSKPSLLHPIAMGAKGYESGDATRDPEPTNVDPNDPNAIPKFQTLAEYQATKNTGKTLLTDYLAQRGAQASPGPEAPPQRGP